MLDELKDLAGRWASAGMVLAPLRNDMSAIRLCCCCCCFDLIEDFHEKDTVGKSGYGFSRGYMYMYLAMHGAPGRHGTR